jgi:type VI secretion system protein ImpG
MPDDLLSQYNSELTNIRRLAAEFASANPGIAENLRISSGSIDDPHVSRLVEAFAYLNARTRQKIEDDFPEITEAYLNTLYPHYLTPFPSTAIMQVELDAGQAELTSGYNIDRGSRVLTDPVDGEPCRFQTCYPVTLFPIKVAEAEFCGPVSPAPPTDITVPVKSFVRIVLEGFSDKIPLDAFECGPIRFYLNGHPPFMHKLYEYLLNAVVGVAVAKSPHDKDAVMLSPRCVQPVGFGRDEGLIDYSPRSFLGYRLLSDYFVLPEKYLFLDIDCMTPAILQKVGGQSRLELFFYLDRESRELENNISADTFRLGCCPITNLSAKRVEPIQLSRRQPEYHVVPDARLPTHFEIHSIDRVVAVSPDGDEEEFLPFYSVRHDRSEIDQRKYWYATRRTTIDGGTEVYLTLVDLLFRPVEVDEWTLNITTTCTNRNLPSRFNFGGGEPRLHIESGGPLNPLRCLTAPTPAYRPELGHGTRWRLISHLTLGHLSLLDTNDGAEGLREILRLYNPGASAESNSVIEGLKTVSSERVVGQVRGPVSAGFCRGVEVTLGFDEDKYVGRGLFPFASLLERFLPLYSSINSFTQLVAMSNRREKPVKSWPPRAGEKSLL